MDNLLVDMKIMMMTYWLKNARNREDATEVQMTKVKEVGRRRKTQFLDDLRNITYWELGGS